MLDSNDFAILTHDENGEVIDVQLPLLQKISTKYPWVNQLITDLTNHPENIAAFYHDFRNNFIS